VADPIEYYGSIDENCLRGNDLNLETYIFHLWINSCSHFMFSINDDIYDTEISMVGAVDLGAFSRVVAIWE